MFYARLFGFVFDNAVAKPHIQEDVDFDSRNMHKNRDYGG